MNEMRRDLEAISRSAADAPVSGVPVSRIISALSYALDLTEGQSLGHSVRSCALGMKLADELKLEGRRREELYYGLLLKDAGCSSNASRLHHILGGDERSAKRAVKLQDWTRVSLQTLRYLKRHVRPDRPAKERFMAVLRMAVKRDEQAKEVIEARCTRGAQIVRKMGFPDGTAHAILYLDEHWNGKGYPHRLRCLEIPMYSQIMNLAQTLEVYNAAHGPQECIDVARRRSGRWFNPELVRIVLSWGPNNAVWKQSSTEEVRRAVDEMAPDGDLMRVDEKRLDDICEAFADVIDAKSPYTYRHSKGVARAAVGTGIELGLDGPALTTLRRAALLHDIGKLSVSNAILEKPGKLGAGEWAIVQKHPYYTERILKKAPIFDSFANMAAAHHEKLDGSGYHLSLDGRRLSISARTLAVADIYDALTADRPYRKGMSPERALRIIADDTPHKLDRDCFEALRRAVLRPTAQPLEPACEPSAGVRAEEAPKAF